MNYYINFDDTQHRFDSLDDIENKNNIKKINYDINLDINTMDFTSFKNIKIIRIKSGDINEIPSFACETRTQALAW